MSIDRTVSGSFRDRPETPVTLLSWKARGGTNFIFFFRPSPSFPPISLCQEGCLDLPPNLSAKYVFVHWDNIGTGVGGEADTACILRLVVPAPNPGHLLREAFRDFPQRRCLCRCCCRPVFFSFRALCSSFHVII